MVNFLLIFFIALAQLILPPTHAQGPGQTLQLEELACKASDPASFKACIEEVKRVGTPIIKITAPIVCKSKTDCAFELKDINANVLIYPSKNTNTITREDDFSYPLLTIENSSGIKFQGVIFEDKGTNPCALATLCPPFLTIKKSSNIQIEKSNFHNTKSTSLKILDSKNILVSGSTFKDSFSVAVEVSSSTPSENIVIEGNSFDSNASNAISFQNISLLNTSSIKSNNFINNYSKAAFINCRYPCIGAQISVMGATKGLKITGNTILGGTNSIFDIFGLYSSGIEVGGQNINGVQIFCNEISGNRGSGIVQSPPFRSVSEISISENKIWGNGLDLNIPTAKIDDNNCYSSECKLNCSNR